MALDKRPTRIQCLRRQTYRRLCLFIKNDSHDKSKSDEANGTNLDADEKVGVVNDDVLHSLFRQVDVFPTEKQVTQATGTYAYKAYLETLHNYGPWANGSQLPAGSNLNLLIYLPAYHALMF